MAHDRLSAIDTSFLQLERLETPMHVGALSIFEGAPFFDADGRFRLAEVRRLVTSRLHRIPRFRRRVVHVPLDAGRPVWVDDRRFDPAYHVRLTAIPSPGTGRQLLALFERVQAQLLDRSRPLWELWFVEGLEGGHVALIQKTHHALVDGVSGVDVATVLLDFSPESAPVAAPAWTPRPAPEPARLLLDSLQETVRQQADLGLAAQRALSLPREAGRRARTVARGLAALADGSVVARPTSLNRPVGRARRFGLVRVSLDDVKTVRHGLGGTVNDVVLAGVTGGLARLFEARAELYPEMTLRVFCPVSVRTDDQRMQLGNRVSGMFVTVPVGEPDPVARLEAIRARTADLKEREQAVGAATLLGMTEFAAPTLLSLAARAAHHQPFCNLVCTNVPGPQVPLYCMGARLLEAYPLVPLARNLNLGVAILSYCGQLHIGLNGDREHWPDLHLLEAGIEDAFAELVKLAREPDAGSPAAPARPAGAPG